MTAEVAILNCTGVALAADSAVTVGPQKTYNSAVKLFALSRVAPVAIMVYGQATLSLVPWELVISEYRRHLGGRRFPALKDYADGLIEFIQSSNLLFNDEVDEAWLFDRAGALVNDVVEACAREVQRSLEESDGEGLDEDSVRAVFRTTTKQCLENIRGWDSLNPPKDVMTRAKSVLAQAGKQLGEKAFGKLFSAVRTDLQAVLREAFKRSMFRGSSSGIVIAGYGDEEIYPSLRSLSFDGAVRGFARFVLDERRTVSISPSGVPATISAYAQEDMVATFMEGINPNVREFLSESLKSALAELPSSLIHVLNTQDAGIEAALSDVCVALQRGIESSAYQFRYDQHVVPILSMVTALPKDELAAMAESLVNLTAFKRRVTGNLETVGGPIDVCVISKGDGLVWVKRKHYFPAELNHMYHQNYLREIAGDSR